MQARGSYEPSRANRLTDIASVVLSLTVGGLFLLALTQSAPNPPPQALLATDMALGAAACVGLLWRRRWPVAVAVALAVISVVSAASAAASLVALFAVAVHRRAGLAVAVGLLNVAAGAGYFGWRPVRDQPLWASLVMTFAVTAAVLAWGMVVRARRQLLSSLTERAERAEREQHLLADQARHAERTRIAREMHDVIAHRVSLVALHAGALEVRPDLPAGQVRDAAALIRTTARQALEELRDVIGVLRDDSPSEAAPQAPQPTLADIGRLVDDSRRAGTHVELQMDVDRSDSAPGPLGRDAYRIVQEALTNVNKHAAGTATTVALCGAPGQGLRVTVRNRLPLAPTPAALPGAGAGLLGLAERAALAGGDLVHGPTGDGDFVVTARLRWPP